MPTRSASARWLSGRPSPIAVRISSSRASCRSIRSAHEAAPPELVEDAAGVVGHRVAHGVQRQLGRRRRLVRIVDAGEAAELAAPRLGVEALAVARLADVERGVDEDLDEAV